MTTASQTQIGYDEARKAVLSGKARSHTLWTIISDEHQRDGYDLQPLIWEGPGEYQHVSFDDGRRGFVRLPEAGRHLPKNTGAAIAKAPA